MVTDLKSLSNRTWNWTFTSEIYMETLEKLWESGLQFTTNYQTYKSEIFYYCTVLYLPSICLWSNKL